jgi:hypothetical protein
LASSGRRPRCLGLVFVGLSINLRELIAYWWPASVVVFFVGALTNAWVLLVEILG